MHCVRGRVLSFTLYYASQLLCWVVMQGSYIDCVLCGAVTLAVHCAGDTPEVTEEQAVQEAVAKQIEMLDEAFLAALGAYSQAAEAQSDPLLAGSFQEYSCAAHVLVSLENRLWLLTGKGART